MGSLLKANKRTSRTVAFAGVAISFLCIGLVSACAEEPGMSWLPKIDEDVCRGAYQLENDYGVACINGTAWKDSEDSIRSATVRLEIANSRLDVSIVGIEGEDCTGSYAGFFQDFDVPIVSQESTETGVRLAVAAPESASVGLRSATKAAALSAQGVCGISSWKSEEVGDGVGSKNSVESGCLGSLGSRFWGALAVSFNDQGVSIVDEDGSVSNLDISGCTKVTHSL